MVGVSRVARLAVDALPKCKRSGRGVTRLWVDTWAAEVMEDSAAEDFVGDSTRVIFVYHFDGRRGSLCLDGLVASSTSSVGMGGSFLSRDGPWVAVMVFGISADTDACLKRLGYALLCTIVIERLLVVW
jgi:hypothetical protein